MVQDKYEYLAEDIAYGRILDNMDKAFIHR